MSVLEEALPRGRFLPPAPVAASLCRAHQTTVLKMRAFGLASDLQSDGA